MPVFVCYLSTTKKLAARLPDRPLFVVRDSNKREWLCIETTLETISGDPSKVARELLKAKSLIAQAAPSAFAAGSSVIACPNETELEQLLSMLDNPSRGPRIKYRPGNKFRWVSIEADNKTLHRWTRHRIGPVPEEQEEPAMVLSLQSIPVPLRAVVGGGVRVGDSRVSLDVVIAEFKRGADPEAIAHDYPTLQLADVYAVIAYYLRNEKEVEAYLRARQAEAEELRQKIEAKQGSQASLREKLLARKAKKEREHASPAE